MTFRSTRTQFLTISTSNAMGPRTGRSLPQQADKSSTGPQSHVPAIATPHKPTYSQALLSRQVTTGIIQASHSSMQILILPAASFPPLEISAAKKPSPSVARAPSKPTSSAFASTRNQGQQTGAWIAKQNVREAPKANSPVNNHTSRGNSQRRGQNGGALPVEEQGT